MDKYLLYNVLAFFVLFCMALPEYGVAAQEEKQTQTITGEQVKTIDQNQLQELALKEQNQLKTLHEEAENKVRELKEKIQNATTDAERQIASLEINRIYQETSLKALDIRLQIAKESGNTEKIAVVEAEKAKYLEAIQPKPATKHSNNK